MNIKEIGEAITNKNNLSVATKEEEIYWRKLVNTQNIKELSEAIKSVASKKGIMKYLREILKYLKDKKFLLSRALSAQNCYETIKKRETCRKIGRGGDEGGNGLL